MVLDNRGIAKIAFVVIGAAIAIKIFRAEPPLKAVNSVVDDVKKVAKDIVTKPVKTVEKVVDKTIEAGADLMALAVSAPQKVISMLKGVQKKGSVEAKAKMRAIRNMPKKKKSSKKSKSKGK